MLRLWEGSVRRALSEPSIGSITTRAGAAGAEADLAALLGDGDERGALRRPAPRARRRPRPRSGGRSPGCGRRPRRPPRRRCGPRCPRTSLEDRAAARRRCGGRFPASLRRKRPSSRILWRPPTRLALDHARPRRGPGARDPARRGPAAACSARPGPARPRCWRGAWRGSPREGTGPERVLVLASTRATAQRLRERVEALLDGPYEELWIGTWEALGERLLREHSDGGRARPLLRRARPGRAAGDAARPPRRAAAAPPRDPRQPGRPAGPPAGADRRAEGRAPSPPEPGARRALRRPRPHPRRAPAASTAATSSSPSTASSPSAPTSAPRSPTASRYVMVDELEDTTPAQRAILAALAAREPEPPLRRWRTAGCRRGRRRPGPAAWFRDLHPDGARSIELGAPVPRARSRASGAARNERAQAQAVAREVEHLLAGGHRAGGDLRPGRRPGAAGRARSRRRWRSAASPSTSPARPPSSSGPRCATRSPGCGCSPTPTTRPRRRGR